MPILYVRRFSYTEIKRATGGFNRVVYTNPQCAAYNAKFQDGSVALVKELRALNDDVFKTEVQLLGRLHHRHLLTLRGFSRGHKRFDDSYLDCQSNEYSLRFIFVCQIPYSNMHNMRISLSFSIVLFIWRYTLT